MTEPGEKPKKNVFTKENARMFAMRGVAARNRNRAAVAAARKETKQLLKDLMEMRVSDPKFMERFPYADMWRSLLPQLTAAQGRRDGTVKEAVVVSMVYQAMRGNVKAANFIFDILGENKSKQVGNEIRIKWQGDDTGGVIEGVVANAELKDSGQGSR